MYTQGCNGMGEIDFGSIIKDVASGYVAYSQAKSATEIAKLQAQQGAALNSFPSALNYQLNPNYSGSYGVPQTTSSNMMPILLMGGAAVLVLFLLMRK